MNVARRNNEAAPSAALILKSMKISQDQVILNQVVADSKLHPVTHHKSSLTPSFKINPQWLWLLKVPTPTIL